MTSALSKQMDILKWITSRGLGVHVGFRRVLVWDRNDPNLEWEYPSLKAAFEDLKRPAP